MRTQRSRPFHALRLFGPYSFVDVADGEAERTAACSWSNGQEALLVLHTVAFLLREHADVVGQQCEHIGVVSPYNGQVSRTHRRNAPAARRRQRGGAPLTRPPPRARPPPPPLAPPR